MGVTKLNDVINPEVMADMIDAKVTAQAKLTPYAKVDDTLEGVAGDTITVPCWNYVGDAEDYDVEAGGEMGVNALTATSTSFSVKCAGKAIAIYQTVLNSAHGREKVVAQAESQLAKSIVNKVDNDILDACYTSTNVVDKTAGVIAYAGIVDCATKFEDEEDGVEKVMFINPRQETALLKDADFLSADKFTSGVAVNGAIGKIAGCWVKKSKKVKLIKFEKDNVSGTIEIVADSVTETSTKKHLATIQPYCQAVLAIGDKVGAELATSAQYYINPIIKMEADSSQTEYTEDELPAITIFLKKETEVAHEYFPKKQRHDITATKYYGVALTNAEKVVLGKFKA